MKNVAGMFIEECLYNQMCENIKEMAEKEIKEYESKTKFQKVVYDTKLNMSIMRNKNMSIKDKLFTVIWGA